MPNGHYLMSDFSFLDENPNEYNLKKKRTKLRTEGNYPHLSVCHFRYCTPLIWRMTHLVTHRNVHHRKMK